MKIKSIKKMILYMFTCFSLILYHPVLASASDKWEAETSISQDSLSGSSELAEMSGKLLNTLIGLGEFVLIMLVVCLALYVLFFRKKNLKERDMYDYETENDPRDYQEEDDIS